MSFRAQHQSTHCSRLQSQLRISFSQSVAFVRRWDLFMCVDCSHELTLWHFSWATCQQFSSATQPQTAPSPNLHASLYLMSTAAGDAVVVFSLAHTHTMHLAQAAAQYVFDFRLYLKPTTSKRLLLARNYPIRVGDLMHCQLQETALKHSPTYSHLCL